MTEWELDEIATGGSNQDLWPDVSPAPPATTVWEAVELGTSPGGRVTFVDAMLQEQQIEFSELVEMAERAAAALREEGLSPGDRVCIVGFTSVELLAVLLGCWRAGLVPTLGPLPHTADVSSWVAALSARLSVIDGNAIAVAEPLRDLISEGVSQPTLTFERLLSHDDRLSEPPPVRPTDVAYLQFTSGSTGASRAVALGHTQILWNACHDINHICALGQEDVRYSWLPLYHDFGLIFTLAGVFAGAPLILQSPDQFLTRPGSWMDACSRYGARVTGGPSSTYGVAARDLMLNPRELDLSPLELALNGSEPVDAATMDRFAEAAGRYGMPATAGAAAYGLAECTLAVACTRRWDPLQSVTVMRDGLGEQGSVVRTAEPGAPGARRLVTCGRSDDATEIQILDASGKPLPPWHVGEIVVRGPSVMLGYWGDDEATSHALRAGRLHTGDLGFVTDELELVPCGRIKDMIIVAGRNLYPEDYEFVAEGVNGVRKGNAVAFSLPGSEHMVLVVETRLESDDASRLLGELGDSLSAEFDVAPSEILAVAPGTVPKTSSGKRERQRCRELYLAGELHPITSTAA